MEKNQDVSRRDFLKLAAGVTAGAVAGRAIPAAAQPGVEPGMPVQGMIHNPILPGFHPDPSILRVGDEYYIANSTFEWFPGVQVSHSRDLVHWRVLTYPLTRRSQLDLRGAIPSNGVWAPCLSHDGDLFYLAYSNMASRAPRYWDLNTYLVTAENIEGPWSEPIYLNSAGFDASLFHDASTGKKWLLNMIQDPRPNKKRFAGIALQEYSPAEKKLIGSPQVIFTGTALGYTEGPHIYRHNEYYYLMCAEGGTGLGHAVTVARSKNLAGPYEVDPQNPILTSSGTDPSLVILQKAGHASLVDVPPTGDWYIAHLCARPLLPSGRCILGRETALQKVIWDDSGWLRLESGEKTPQVDVAAPALADSPWPALPVRDEFDITTLGFQYQVPREPVDPAWLSLSERPGFLRLRGRMSPNSRFDQSTVARRIQAFQVEAETCLEFDPVSPLQMAGLLAMYDEIEWFWLAVTYDDNVQGKVLRLVHRDNDSITEPLNNSISIKGWNLVYLKSRIDETVLRFFYSSDGVNWTQAGGDLDASTLSDEYPIGRFTGSFFALSAMDLQGTGLPADFDYFTYREPTNTWLPYIGKR